MASRRKLSEEEQEQLVNELLADFVVVSQDYQIIDGEDQQQRTWLYGRKSSIDWRFWRRYRDFSEQEAGLPVDTINKMDNLTDDILDRLTNPHQAGSWDRRGMVVGNVQSGKTGNYTGLICKAADAGYRIIIVLTGLHSSLRSQTQYRLDEGFLGRDTQMDRLWIPGRENDLIGAGLFNKNFSANALTTNAENGDFSMPAARASGITIRSTDPVLIVVKKNVSVLNALLQWLGAQGEKVSAEGNHKIIRNLPMLLIDDEADNASVNVSDRTISAINRNIRALLSLFEQKAYVGYTATPYANVYIPLLNQTDYDGQNHRVRGAKFMIGQDLFPRDFIVNLPAPSNYIGAARIFGLGTPLNDDQTEEATTRLIPVVRLINDYAPYIPDRHKMRDMVPDELPPSLVEAMRCFILSCAIRRVRGHQNKHNSMLVHVSRFILWQDAIAELVDGELKNMQRDLRYGNGAILNELKTLFERDYIPVTRQVVNTLLDEPHWRDPAVAICSWEDVLPALLPAAEKIVVRVAHGALDKSGGNPLHRPLNYVDHERRGLPDDGTERGLSVIAVGGDKLSRGLTLEGLSVSYFLRASRMYDTLMQMGRWFGYRPGYVDLCRLFTTSKLLEWYQHITLASEEMREQFDEMVQLNRTPRDYGLKIRTLPGVLQVTAANKMRTAIKMELSYSDRLMETYSFERNPAMVKANHQLTRELIAGLGRLGALPQRTRLETTPQQPYTWQGVSSDTILDFLRKYRTNQPNIDPFRLTDYIQRQAARGVLTSWTVVLISADRKESVDNPAFPFIIDGEEQPVTSTYRQHARPRGEKSTVKPAPPVPPLTEGPYMVSRSHIISPRHEMLDLKDDQLEAAYTAHREAKEEEQRKTREHARQAGLPEPSFKEIEIELPSGRFVRDQRPPRQALLLLYPLNPAPAGFELDTPIIGYAISFPRIADDARVEYAVNEVFRKEFETDFDEVDPDEEALSK